MHEPEKRWYPILAAREEPTGTWKMIDSLGKCYGIIRIMRRVDEVYYKAQTWHEHENGREMIGHFRTLHQACNATHQLYLTKGSPGRPSYEFTHGGDPSRAMPPQAGSAQGRRP